MNKIIVMISTLMLLVFYTSAAQADQSQALTEQQIETKISEKWQEYIHSKAFERRVEEVILQFVEKQNQAQANQQRAANEARFANLNPVDSKQDYIRGQKNAEFSLIEYSDYECPFCKRFHPTAAKFIQRNPDVNWIYRHFPLNFHNPGAQKEAEAAECAGALGGNEVFWRYSDQIYQRTRSNGKGFPIANLVPLAVELGLEKETFAQCLDNERFKEKVLSQFANGQRAGVTGTPGNFLRHNPTGTTIAIHGAQPLGAVEQALAQLKQRLQ